MTGGCTGTSIAAERDLNDGGLLAAATANFHEATTVGKQISGFVGLSTGLGLSLVFLCSYHIEC